jgi:hypothetical protein
MPLPVSLKSCRSHDLGKTAFVFIEAVHLRKAIPKPIAGPGTLGILPIDTAEFAEPGTLGSPQLTGQHPVHTPLKPSA